MISYQDSRYLRATAMKVTGPGGDLLQPVWFDFYPKPLTTVYPDNNYVTADTSFSWAHLGMTYLQDARAWWAIAEFSGVLDPFEELGDDVPVGKPPVVLTVPSPSTFYFNVSGG